MKSALRNIAAAWAFCVIVAGCECREPSDESPKTPSDPISEAISRLKETPTAVLAMKLSDMKEVFEDGRKPSDFTFRGRQQELDKFLSDMDESFPGYERTTKIENTEGENLTVVITSELSAETRELLSIGIAEAEAELDRRRQAGDEQGARQNGKTR